MTKDIKPMFKDIKALKEFLLWAKTEGIQALEIGEVKVQFTALALPVNQEPKVAPISDTRTPQQIALDRQKEEDDILFHSVS